jgi:hypothetical protein
MRITGIGRPQQAIGRGYVPPQAGLGAPCPPGTILNTFGSCSQVATPPPGRICLPGSVWANGPYGPECLWNAAYPDCPPGTTWESAQYTQGANRGCVCPPGTYWVVAPGDTTGRNGACLQRPAPPLPPGSVVQRPAPPLPPGVPRFPRGFNPYAGTTNPAPPRPHPVPTSYAQVAPQQAIPRAPAAAPPISAPRGHVAITGLPAGVGARCQLNPQLG